MISTILEQEAIVLLSELRANLFEGVQKDSLLFSFNRDSNGRIRNKVQFVEAIRTRTEGPHGPGAPTTGRRSELETPARQCGKGRQAVQRGGQGGEGGRAQGQGQGAGQGQGQGQGQGREARVAK
eukprot:GFYU01007169.1.p2 GENE.GFYU01007169.1~~GFYU01007169.1.p2  ORF type:complete len:125 (-),score=6.86 GFYU01007169.1:331-705(-)